MGFKGRKTTNKNPPIFSHEFVIQNHADIVSCVAMLFVIGLLVQMTSPLAYMFIAVQHNVTIDDPQSEDITYFTSGWKDTCAVFFYFLICIVIHAIVQEYILDKVSRKLHLSKVKHSLFNESGQLVFFYLLSVVWGADIIFKENYFLNIASLWEGYPHTEMTFLFKFFYIIQLSYWLHCYPELYFQKVKKEEIPHRVQYATANLIFVFLAYMTNFTRVGLCLIVLHQLSEASFHSARLLDFADKNEMGTQVAYMISKVAFVLVRLGSIILSVLTFWYGLSLSENQGLDVSTGNFNTQLIRILALLTVGSLQAYLMWNFITSQLARMRELSSLQQSSKKKTDKKQVTNKKRESESEKESEPEKEKEKVKEKEIKKEKDKSKEKEKSKQKQKKRTALDELTEVDQNTAKKQNIRSRGQKAK